MRINKVLTYPMDRCYANGFLNIDSKVQAVFASEAIDGDCVAFDLANLDDTTSIWTGKGGTMNFHQTEDKNSFLAIQNFFPGYNSKESKIVRVKKEHNKYVLTDILKIPYLHRFGILNSWGKKYFVGSTLSSSKQFREDWSDPGKVYVGDYTDDTTYIAAFPLLDGLVKNHGFTIEKHVNYDSVLISSENGVFRIIPPSETANWRIDKQNSLPSSEAIYADLDMDGVDEELSIEPFHGNSVLLRKKGNIVWSDNSTQEFIHALWVGEMFGKNYALIGSRKGGGDLYILQYDEKKHKYSKMMVESNVGCANVSVIFFNEKYFIASSNHSTKHAAIYTVEND